MSSQPITWQRTEIGGETAPYDFVATVGGEVIGRITRIPHHPNQGHWNWSLTMCVPGVNFPKLPPLRGKSKTKAGAIEQIGWAFELLSRERRKVAITAHDAEPDEME